MMRTWSQRVLATVAVLILAGGCSADRSPTDEPPSPSAVDSRDQPPAHATATPARTTQATTLWDVWEQRVDVGADEEAVVAHFFGPDRSETTVEAVTAENDTMLVRFRPHQPGTWHYEIRLAGTPMTEHRGSFVVEHAPADNPLLNHGPVGVPHGATWFQHADGTPFLWIADTAWSGPLLSEADEWERYLADRVAKGFTTIQVVLTSWRAAPTNAEGQAAFATEPIFAIDPAFFERVDERIEAANRAGLLVAAAVLWANGDGPLAAPAQLPEGDAIDLARYLVNRYRAHHVVWFLGGDVRITEDSLPRWNAIADAVFEGTDETVAMHPVGRDWPYPTMAGSDDWMSFLGYQSGHDDGSEALRWIYDGPHTETTDPRPIVNLELPYEAHLSYDTGTVLDSYAVRRAAYWSVLSTPTAGVSYGAHGLWSWESVPREPIGHAGSGVAMPWHEALDLPGSHEIGHLAGLLRSLEWWTLEPAPYLLDEQPGIDDPTRHVAVARSRSGDVVAYAPRGGTIRLRDLPDGYEAEWMDPRTGSRRGAEPLGNGRLEAPDDSDWVVVIRAP
jgi:hypothetical protein